MTSISLLGGRLSFVHESFTSRGHASRYEFGDTSHPYEVRSAVGVMNPTLGPSHYSTLSAKMIKGIVR